jgi:xyloglucan-specific endo-beta-1,4-glucanase
MKVYSFLTTTPNSPYTTFNSDAKLFFDYLTANQGFPASTQNLIGKSSNLMKVDIDPLLTYCLVYQVGTEAFTGGPAKFSVSSFSASVNV